MNQQTAVISVRDKKLILQRAQMGDPEALNVLFESCRGRLFACALRILPGSQDAEDAVQEAMLSAFKHLHQFRGSADFLTWATRIVINAAMGQIRRARSRRAVSWDQSLGDSEQVAGSEFIEDPKPDPEQVYQQVEHRRLFREALQHLPARYRLAIQLCGLGDCSLKDAAATLGLPISTLKARLHRGRSYLVRKLRGKMRHEVSRNERRSEPQPVEQKLRAA